MNSANVSSVDARPSCTARIAAIRPRGDADSSPVNRYVGQCGRHRPHATQAFRSACVGASPSAQFVACPGSGPMNRAPSGRSEPSGFVSMCPHHLVATGSMSGTFRSRSNASATAGSGPSISRAMRWPSKIASEIIRGATQSPIR